ncbi:tail fiber domain-containing protein [Otariodibacter oris]|uniref:Endosialidase-like protein n=1 Tax=Otariodibacter oris TaxID=1032623 RepID=A0A420XJ74_9PAST|nr:tail fiber domain-containing protein [Otariodibacter oris]QGM80652.1 hypothetical protein A6A10_04165 [Otariodibacter oris]RKR77188.1 endosialidase-like protein [Otariodibacter oris]
MREVMKTINTATGRFVDGNPSTGEYGTIVTAEFLNNIQDGVINLQKEAKTLLKEAGIEPDGEQLNQITLAIKSLIDKGYQQQIENLGAADAYKLIGQAESVGQLRTIRPESHGQRIIVKSYYEGGVTGGGEFIADLQDLITPDDGGVCFVVENNGGRWKRVFKKLTINDFGFLKNSNQDDVVQFIDKTRLPIDCLGQELVVSNLPQYIDLFTNACFKIGKLLYPTPDFFKTDVAKVTNAGIYVSHPQDSAYLLNNQIRCWVSTADSHLDAEVQAALIFSEDAGTSYSSPNLLDITRQNNTIWSAGVSQGFEYLFERKGGVQPFSYALHKRKIPEGETANYSEKFTITDIEFPLPSWTSSQPVMIHSFAPTPNGFVVGASWSEGCGLYKSEDGGASFTFIELAKGSEFEEPTVKCENGIFAGFIRNGNNGGRPYFWFSDDNLNTINRSQVPEGVFLNNKLQDSCVPLIITDGVIHAFTTARNGSEAGFTDDRLAPIYYIKCDINKRNTFWDSAQVFMVGYAYHAEKRGASACGQGSVVKYENKIIYLYGSEERTGSHLTLNRIANIHALTLFDKSSSGMVDFKAKTEILRAGGDVLKTLAGENVFATGNAIFRSSRTVSGKTKKATKTRDNIVIDGGRSSAGVTITTDGPYAQFSSVDDENTICGIRVDNTNSAIQIVSKSKTMMRYDHAANSWRPEAHNDNKTSLGGVNTRFSQIYAGTGAISTSDGRLKKDVGQIPDDVIEAWREVNFIQYKWKDSVEEKGLNARFHTGVIAQNIKETFESKGLNAQDYGLLCFESWEGQPEIRDEDGTIIQEAIPSGDRWAIRADECLFMEVESARRKSRELEKRLLELEGKLD